MSESEKYNGYTHKELDAYNQALDTVLEIIDRHKKTYPLTPEYDHNRVALFLLVTEIRREYV